MKDNEYKSLVELITNSIISKQENDIYRLLDFAQNYCNFDSAIVARLEMNDSGGAVNKVLNHSYDKEWIDTYINEKFAGIDPVMKYALNSPNPFAWEDAYRNIVPHQFFLDAALDHGLKSGIAFALRGRDNHSCDILSFSNVDQLDSGMFILKSILPVITDIIDSSAVSKKKSEAPSLTPKELEVLRWAKEGKSIWDISVILGITERTVKFHLLNIHKKFNVLNRAQAIAKAYEYGLL